RPHLVHHADRCLVQRHVQADIVLHCRSPSLRGHMRPASYVPGELIPLPLSGSLPELPDVAKVENRATRKISRKLIFGLLRRCVAFQRHYGGPWSILDEVIWSPHVAARKTYQRL